ncbi:hypothetical protein O3P69_009127 [Scylla paramamosain]|uniref:Uncharacterized protein n=1 Tax=Scylla paramamosain TaxID=85552 RepID=A0AAW0T9Z2_SCYPA
MYTGGFGGVQRSALICEACWPWEAVWCMDSLGVLRRPDNVRNAQAMQVPPAGEYSSVNGQGTGSPSL